MNTLPFWWMDFRFLGIHQFRARVPRSSAYFPFWAQINTSRVVIPSFLWWSYLALTIQSPHFLCWGPSFHCYGVKWYLEEVSRVRWSHEGVLASYKATQFPPRLRTEQYGILGQPRRKVILTWPYLCPDFRLLVSWVVRSSFLSLCMDPTCPGCIVGCNCHVTLGNPSFFFPTKLSGKL